MDHLLGKLSQKGILVAAHRGSAGGNIPCNSLAAFEAALYQGADIIETDVLLSADGEPFIFHRGQEKNHLNREICLEKMTSDQIRGERYVNQDNAQTQWGILSLEEFLELVRGRCLVNLDHAWNCLEETIQVVDRLHMRDQVILKTPAKEPYLELVEKIAPDIMYMPILRETDDFSHIVEKRKINFAAVQVDFTYDTSELAQDAYLETQRKAGRLVWVNSLIYNYKKQLSGGHNDDVSMAGDPEYGWGYLCDKGFDIIQTDWVLALRQFLIKKGKRNETA